MNTFGFHSIKLAHYKCFGDEPQGFDELKPINLIIGRNNSGKSTAIEIVRFGIEGLPEIPAALFHREKQPRLIVSTVLSESALKRVYPPGTSGGAVRMNFWEYGKRFVDQGIDIEVRPKNGSPRTLLNKPKDLISPNGPGDQGPFEKTLSEAFPYPPIQARKFRHLLAERNIRPEMESDPPSIQGDGTGLTNAIHQFLNYAKHPRSLIDHILLRELNSILAPDLAFTAIQARKIENNQWEIFLEEHDKGLIALSQTGSGFKTVLLVLGFLHILPRIDGAPPGSYVYAFEELENNLHPAILRRLLSYLKSYATEKNAIFLLTTHSSVAIDQFGRDDNAQIIHVSHNGQTAKLARVTTYVEHRGILDDLDVRASDLLQANGVIWVEGPSDRIYLNRWIDLWSKGSLRESTHYQIVFYGGRLLAHLDATPPAEASETVKILQVNRNAAVLIDSDRTDSRTELNATKKRVLEELVSIGGLGWVTAGREIEHYIPPQVLQEIFALDAEPTVDMFSRYSELLDRISPSAGKTFDQNKPLFAEKIVPHLSLDSIAKVADLPKQLDLLCKRIRSWNGLGD